jgi:lipoate-protein ligase B
MKFLNLGKIDYEQCYARQKELHKLRIEGIIDDTVLFVEHPHVITTGRTFNSWEIPDKRILDNHGIKIIEVDRGGSVTYHGPGQLVCYPIIDLSERKKDIHLFLDKMEEIVIAALDFYKVKANSLSGQRGVWVDNKKIASVGVGIKRWVTYHGIAINLNVDLSYFEMIKPCGYDASVMVSLSNIIDQEVDLNQFTQIIEPIIKDHFSC